MVEPIRRREDAASVDTSSRDTSPEIPRALRDSPAALERAHAAAVDTAARYRPTGRPYPALVARTVGETREMLDVAIRVGLDATFRVANGPYAVDGHVVEARAHFRMGPQHGGTSAELLAAARKANVPGLYALQEGRGTLHDLRRVTQALVDAGHLPAGTEPAGERIHQMQWNYGVGVDCAGYVQQAFLAAHGGTRATYGWKTMGYEDLSSVVTNPTFRRVAPRDLRPGDLGVLGVPANDAVGHRVIIYSHKVVDPAKPGKLGEHFGADLAPLLRGGPVHCFEVDSSWGADGGDPAGGVRRDTWLYNEKTAVWSYRCGVGNSTFCTTTSPYNHPLLGFFRPRSEP